MTDDHAHQSANAWRASRRALLAGSGATVLGSALTAPTLAQESSPAASPAAIDPEAFRSLCVQVTGSEDLDDAGLAQLQDLFAAETDWLEALAELMAAEHNPFDMRAWKFPALAVINNILQFWYLGQFKNLPLPNRAERVGRLVTWQTLPYVTVPAVCKAFGYWTNDPGL